ncbi:hypothetical protein C8R42DRAFT_645779 [Lentinula raphanica]|nr:hypothetical protein C8R42DRAFT_645779 [Lentinula raphanica]
MHFFDSSVHWNTTHSLVLAVGLACTIASTAALPLSVASPNTVAPFLTFDAVPTSNLGLHRRSSDPPKKEVEMRWLQTVNSHSGHFNKEESEAMLKPAVQHATLFKWGFIADYNQMEGQPELHEGNAVAFNMEVVESREEYHGRMDRRDRHPLPWPANLTTEGFHWQESCVLVGDDD